MLLRACLGVGGAAALAIGAVWAVAIALGEGSPSVYDSLPVLGLLGVAAWIFSGGSALAYVKTGARRWIANARLGLLCSLLLFDVCNDMKGVTGCG